MTTHFNLKATLVLAAMFCLPAAQAALSSNDDYKASKARISALNRGLSRLSTFCNVPKIGHVVWKITSGTTRV